MNSGGGRVGAAAREMGKMRVALTLLILLGVSSCKEQPVEQQPGYKFGLADGKTIGYGEGRDQMKAEMCKRIRESDDRIHTQLQRNRICE